MIQDTYIQLHSFVLIYNKDEQDKGSKIINEDNRSIIISEKRNKIIAKLLMREKRSKDSLQLKTIDRQRWVFYTGDSSEIEKQNYTHIDCCASSAIIDIDMKGKEVTVFSSIVGLPPIFYCDYDNKIIISSDIHLFSEIHGFIFNFNEDSIRELTTIGYPINNKTLFQKINILPAGHVLKITRDGGIKINRPSKHIPKVETKSWNDFLEAQSAAFDNAVKKINLNNSFLSLTAGIDTRAIFSALTSLDKRIVAYTMSGKRPSLDAIIARKLCNAYQFNHNIIVLSDDFFKSLPNLSIEACRLSGGLSSFSQAHEVYFYLNINHSLTARISGNLGNQVGRGGAENISMRNAGFNSLNKYLYVGKKQDLEHWYEPYLMSGGELSFDFLMENEIPFSSIGNYTLGNNYAIQQSPYANKELIEISKNRPLPSERKQQKSIKKMRIKDLRHRFIGESISRSFQRKYIKETGGAVGKIPINWGGKANGGVSVWGVGLGLFALADAALASKAIDSGPLYKAASIVGIPGIHEYREYKKWLQIHMKEFVLDLFNSRTTRECGLFDMEKLHKNSKQFFYDKEDIIKNISLSLDLALAAQTFDAKLS